MRRLPDCPPAWVRHYIGIPFRDRGRDRARGVDCWGLTRLVYAEQLGVVLPSLDDGYDGTIEPIDRHAISGLIERQRDAQGAWSPAETPAMGDLVLFRLGLAPAHVGVVVAQDAFLHAQAGTDSCLERLSVSWGTRLLGFYRHTGPVRLTGRTRPLDGGRVDVELPAGLTIAEMLEAAGVPASPILRAFVGGVEVPRDRWSHVRPRPGRIVTISAVPLGGGNTGNKALRTVLSIAVIAAAVAAPYALGLTATTAVVPFAATTSLSLGGALLSAGIGLGGLLLVNALVPPPKPRYTEDQGQAVSPTITGSQNQARPYEAVMRILGSHRVAPSFAAVPYTETVGDATYLRQLFHFGYGPIALSELKIGETPLAEFDGVEIEIREGRPGDAPMRLYPSTLSAQDFSVLLRQTEGWTVRTAGADAEELAVDLTLPQGLVEISRDGNQLARTVTAEVEYSPAGLNQWTRINAASPTFTRGLDFLFRTPEVEAFGSGTHTGRLAWGAGFPDARPSSLPATGGFSVEYTGFVFAAVAGVYRFGIDCSDAGDVAIDDRIVASWYGGHAPAGGGGSPSFVAPHLGDIPLTRGWHRLRVRVESRSSAGNLALGWLLPGAGAFVIVPASSLSTTASAAGAGGLSYRAFRTAGYDSVLSITAAKAEAIRLGLAWAVDPAAGTNGAFDVRVRRTTPDTSSLSINDKIYWSSIRAITLDDPVKLEGLCKVAIRIRATDQLNGVVDEFNAQATSIIPDWDAGSGTWIERASSNPASCYRAALQRSGNARPLADSRIDLAELPLWHESCDRLGLSCNVVFDTRRTLYEVLQDIAATGRAAFGMRDGKFSVVRDRKQTVPVQHFTPRNSSGYSGRRAFADLPHGLRVQFLDRERGYQRLERIVLADGYQIGGRDAFGLPAPTLPPATLLETFELSGVTSAEEAFRHGRYHLAVGRLRPEMHEITTDFEHLVCTRGDLVLLTHDVPLFGQASGRVLNQVLDSAGNLVALDVDEEITLDPPAAGVSYAVRCRLRSGASWTAPVVVPAPGPTTRITLGQPTAAGDPRPGAGDLFMFGPTGLETRELLVKSIEVDQDLSARLVLVDHAPAVHDAELGPIPAFEPGITQPAAYLRGPETPVIESIRSDDFVAIRNPDGSYTLRMLVTLRRQSGTRPLATLVQARFRAKAGPGSTGSGPFTTMPTTPLAADQVSVLPVTAGTTYDLMIRTVTPAGRTSDWVTAEHTVIGRVLPPPDVEAFAVTRLSDGTRRYTFRLGLIPPDVVGVKIRYAASPDAKPVPWELMQPLHEGVLEGVSPTDLADPLEAGRYCFGIKMVDASGLESANALLTLATLGPGPQDGIAVSVDARERGWPGEKVGCHVGYPDGSLWSTGRETWDTLPASWDNWTRWVWDPTTPIVYTHPAIDLLASFPYQPAVSIDADGVASVEFRHSTDGVAFAPWAPLASAAGETISSRFAQFRVTVSADAERPVPVVRRFSMLFRAETVTVTLDNLATDQLDASLRAGPGDFRAPVPQGVFALIRSASVSFNNQGAGRTWELVDKAVSPGPRLRIFDSSGALADGVIDVSVRGILAGQAAPPDPGDAGASPTLDFSSRDRSAWIAVV